MQMIQGALVGTKRGPDTPSSTLSYGLVTPLWTEPRLHEDVPARSNQPDEKIFTSWKALLLKQMNIFSN